MQCDSVLFGNGLTISLLSSIQKIPVIRESSELSLLCQQNEYISMLIQSPLESPEYNPVLRLMLSSVNKPKYNYQKSINCQRIIKDKLIHHRKGLSSYCDEIKQEGFENWISNNLLGKDSDLSELATYLYVLNNVWFDQLTNKILERHEVQDVLQSYGKNLNSFKLRMTLNFDTCLDSYSLPIDHLHGRFVVPFTNVTDLFIGEDVYKFLYAAQGLEKLNKVYSLYKNGCTNKWYDLDFFFNNDINYGNFLLFGISFTHAKVVSEDFLKCYPQYRHEATGIGCLDGHILLRLSILQEKNKINSLTVACYNEQDLDRYQQLFKDYHVNADFIVGKGFDYYVIGR